VERLELENEDEANSDKTKGMFIIGYKKKQLIEKDREGEVFV